MSYAPADLKSQIKEIVDKFGPEHVSETWRTTLLSDELMQEEANFFLKGYALGKVSRTENSIWSRLSSDNKDKLLNWLISAMMEGGS